MLFSESFELVPYNAFFLGLLMLVIGLEELKKGEKGYRYLSIAVSLFIFLSRYKYL
ncbi:DUF3953 domain-containing protein [Cytobacillus oceanisediminis]|uniref:DUF3953 domain-containing protein n=1 Tax=Cytobacillus oceanisediminis TaxID=665099 RepID=UPI000D70C385|nr:DUF3953 domain-containing protein [Cytobacillus oceanisediminis]